LESVSIPKTDAASGNQPIYVRFSPGETSVGAINGILTFKSTGANSKTMNLNGNGISIQSIITVSETSLDFGVVKSNTPIDKPVVNE